MAGELNAYAVLDIAERMERDAARFYRKAAGICDDPKLCKLFADLAQWERRHLELFAEMRERLSAQSVESWYPALKEIQRQVMKPPVFEESDDLSKELSGCTRTDVLEMAIGIVNEDERYLGMYEFCCWHQELLKKYLHSPLSLRCVPGL